jgi:hypothetical protein
LSATAYSCFEETEYVILGGGRVSRFDGAGFVILGEALPIYRKIKENNMYS